MPVLNDFGDAGVARVERVLQDFAAKLGVDKEYVYAFFNHTGHLPQTIGEFQTFLNDPNTNPYHIQRRDPTTGALTQVRPGPTPGKTALERGGFPHNITNAEDTAVERFQQVDPSGNIFGGSWDPAYNAAHPELAGQSADRGAQMFTKDNWATDPATRGTPAGSGPTPEQIANARALPDFAKRQVEQSNGWPPGSLGGGGPTGPTTTPAATPGPGAAPFQGSTTGATSSGLPGAADRTAIVDANAYGNTQQLQARIDEAIRNYAVARTQQEREAAYLDLQRWQTELKKIQDQQKTVTDMATAVLSAATSLGSRPKDFVQFDQTMSGGRDIFDRISGQGGPAAAFGGPSGRVQPGSIFDLLNKLGIQYPTTPPTPAVAQPGSGLPHLPDLPAVPVPGSAGVPGALQPGATGDAGTAAPVAGTTSLPAYEQMLRELDTAAGGQWSGNRADRPTVASAWWNANPSRRGTPMPAF